MLIKYPFIVVAQEDGWFYGYFPDIKDILIKDKLISSCLIAAEKEIIKILKKYQKLNKSLPVANHISYYVCKKGFKYVTNITVII